ncbi:hypothetical protein H1C71_009697 [Ictidomys tridecemlineatus]|nr:hypothetical protein H1C71_009697 [Ictidomys tridecemlineatus]
MCLNRRAYTGHRCALWNQTQCPSMDEWIKKMWSIHTVELYSDTKKNEIISSAEKWMELENTMLRKISQIQKVMCLLSYVETREKIRALGVWGGENKRPN